jgi:hypothetical protein
MTIKAQLDRIRNNEMIEDIGEEEARKVFRSAVHAFRKWLSPVRSPAASWIGHVDIMMIKCRLDNDAQTYAELLAARIAAKVDSTVQPGEYDELVHAAGLDVVKNSKTSIGKDGRIEIGSETKTPGSYRVVFRGIAIELKDAPIEAEFETDDILEAIKSIDNLTQRNTGGARYVEVKYEVAPESEAEIFDTVHDPWKPTKVFSSDLKAHPTRIIEPSTLAATSFPDPIYKPLLPAEAIKRGFISDAQFETIVYALQAVTTYLPGSPKGRHGRCPKGGFIIGDGTGVGKTNEICGIIMDQWMRGVKRHIIVVERAKHVPHIQEAWSMIGGNPRDIFFQGDTGATEPVPERDGVLVTTYALIRSDERYRSLLDWANSRTEMNGILAFDEAHNMRNAVEDAHEEGAGKKNQSQQGKRGVEIQDDLPEAGVIYASATMATDVYNLGYAPRLGLWGENAPFVSAEAFIGEMHLLDDGALEQICIDLKAAGRYTSRTLSFDGVEYEELIHRLTPNQRKYFDQTIQNWKTIHEMMNKCLLKAGGSSSYARGRATQMKRALVEQTLALFNVETLIGDIHKELARGNSPVVQIAYTGEARLQRIANGDKYISKDKYLDDGIIRWIQEKFPVGKVYRDKNKAENVAVTDANGNPHVDPEIEKEKKKALAIAEKLAIRESILDKILLEFGTEQVAEVTGRSIRAVPRLKAGELIGWDIEDRSSQDAMNDVEAFHQGKKSILVFSLAAGGTGLGYHASEKSKNQGRRVHYILELGRRAESAVQGLGRTHRSDQVSAPIVKIVMSDVPAHAIYAAKTLNKIQKMGALSRGHQHATTNAIFEQRVPISGKYAEIGWKMTLKDIEDGKLGDVTIENLAKDLGVDIKHSTNSINSLEVAIRQLATLTDGDQRMIVGKLTENTEEAIASAIRQGTYNQGMETIRANSIEIVDENKINNANGTQTTYYRLRKRDEIEQLPFRRASGIAAASRAKKAWRSVFMRHKVNGRIQLAVMKDGPSGLVDIYMPGGTTTRHRESLMQEPWKVIENLEEAERIWNLESENLDMRKETDLHILSGSLLYNWDKLPKTGLGLNRCKTDDGQVIIGRVIHQRELRKTLSSMGMQSNYRPAQISTMLAKVEKGAVINIDNGWTITKGFGSSYRLNIPDDQQTGVLRNDLSKMGILSHDTPLGYELEIPKEKSIDIIQSIVVGCEIGISGTTSFQKEPSSQTSAQNTAPLPIAALK